MARWNSNCKVCGEHTVFNVQVTNFYPDEWIKGRKSIFEPCCKECQEEYLSNPKKFCSLRALLNLHKVTRLDWANQGGE